MSFQSKTYCLIYLLTIACGKSSTKYKSVELIHDTSEQKSIFKNLTSVINRNISEFDLSDSLAFLILPVQASCPSCRKKTIDSIVKYYNKLDDRHFIIVSANGGRKTVASYFREQGHELPLVQRKIYLDTINQAFKLNLYSENPTLYYTYQLKVYKRVEAIPATVRQDLKEFFWESRR